MKLRRTDFLHLAHDFHRNRALPGNNIGVVKRVDEGQVLFLLQLEGVFVGIGKALACQYGLAAHALDGIDLDLWGGCGHYDHRAHAQAVGGQCHTLGMVARRCTDHSGFELLG
ncbi:hypothetical protein D3C71_1684870 [compost metagenome]